MADNNYQDLKAQLIATDKELMEQINRRARITRRLNRAGGPDSMGAFACTGEPKILAAIKERNRGPVSHELMAAVFTEIEAACSEYRPSRKIAFLGGEGSFSQLAARKQFGKSQSYMACMSVTDVFSAVEREQAVLGVVPLENSLEGSVIQTYHELMRSELKIVGEIYLSLSYSLLSRASDTGEIKTVLGPKYALDHCRDWLTRNLAHAGREESASTMAAIKQCGQDPGLAVIASFAAAQPNGLSVLADDIQDQSGISNRYLILGHGMMPDSGRDKTTLLFAAKHRPGALLQALKCFAEHNVNLSRIESRPALEPKWQYVFFADLEGNAQEDKIIAAMDSLGTQTDFLKVLGSYANGEPLE